MDQHSSASRTPSIQMTHEKPTRPDPMAALRFLHEEGAVSNVSVRGLTAFWEGELSMQSQSDVAVKTVRGDHTPSSNHSECGHNPIMLVTCSTRQRDLMTNAIREALRSTHLTNLIVCATQIALDRQEDSSSDMIRKALRSVGCAQHSKEVVTSVIRNKVPFRWIDNVILLGINDMLPSGQLNDFVLDTIGGLLVSGALDNILQDEVRNMMLPQHEIDENESEMATVVETVPLRQLDDILLDIFNELMDSGELDDIHLSIVSEMLQTGKFDGIIRNTLALFENEKRDDDVALQRQDSTNKHQQSFNIGDSQQWLLESTVKLLELLVVWDVFERLQTTDDSLHIHCLLESLQNSWEQLEQSRNGQLLLRIRTAKGTYMVEMGQLITLTGEQYPRMLHSTNSLLNLEEEYCVTENEKQRSKSIAHLDRDHNGSPLQLPDNGRDMNADVALQHQDSTDKQQQFPKKGDWQQWLWDSTVKLLQFQVIWDVFDRLQAIDGGLDIQGLLEPLQSSWEQPEQSQNRRLSLKIRTIQGMYMIEIGPLTTLIEKWCLRRSQSARSLFQLQTEDNVPEYKVQRSKSIAGSHLSPEHDGSSQLPGRGRGIDAEIALQLQDFAESQQHSPDNGNTQPWLWDSTVKLLQLQVVWDVFKRLKIFDGTLDLQSLLESLQISWEEPQESQHRGLTLSISTAKGTYMIAMTPLTILTEEQCLWGVRNSSSLLKQALCDVILEAVIPTCAIYMLSDDWVRNNVNILSALRSGKVHHEMRPAWLISGSTAEGLTVGLHWGHPWPDMDTMYLYGSQLGVIVPGQKAPKRNHDKSCLEYAPEGCPSAYTRLRVTNLQGLLLHPYVDAECVEEEDGHLWLNTLRLNERIQSGINTIVSDPANRSTGISGPAGEVSLSGFPVDCVPTLVANAPHPAIEEYIKRSRGEWPSQEQLREIQQLPLSTVLVGSKESQNRNQQARNSWSHGEMLLISKLPKIIKQGIITAKYAFKHRAKIYRDDSAIGDGRSRVGSYHLKTTLLNHLEKESPSKINSAFHVMMSVFQDLYTYLTNGNLPHYFFPECNLLATVGYDERQIALQAIQDIISDPITTILQCPSEPTEIYGDIYPYELVTAFHGVCNDPCCEQSWEDLVQLLFRLDLWRQRRYRFELEVDEGEVSGRPELIGLVDMLESWRNDNI